MSEGRSGRGPEGKEDSDVDQQEVKETDVNSSEEPDNLASPELSRVLRADERDAERMMGTPLKKRKYMRMAHTRGGGGGREEEEEEETTATHDQKTSTDVKPKSHEQSPTDGSTESVKRNVIGTEIEKKPRTRPRVGINREHSQQEVMEQGNYPEEPSPSGGIHVGKCIIVENVNPKPGALDESKEGALEVPATAGRPTPIGTNKAKGIHIGNVKQPEPVHVQDKEGTLLVPASGGECGPIGIHHHHKAKGNLIEEDVNPKPVHDQTEEEANPIGITNKGKSISLLGNENPTPKPLVQGQGNYKEGGSGGGDGAADPAFPRSVTTDVKVDGFSLSFLFKRELTRNEIANKVLIIPRNKAERHFPTLKNPDGSYREEVLMVSDALFRRWRMKIKLSLIAESYMISGHWSEYVSTYGLQAKDVVRVFKVVKPVPDKHYFIDFVRAGEEVGTHKSQSDRVRPGGKEGDGGGSSRKEHGFNNAHDKGIASNEKPAKGHWINKGF